MFWEEEARIIHTWSIHCDLLLVYVYNLIESCRSKSCFPGSWTVKCWFIEVMLYPQLELEAVLAFSVNKPMKEALHIKHHISRLDVFLFNACGSELFTSKRERELKLYVNYVWDWIPFYEFG